jgi:polyisoprenoid-binding protein YceI
VDVASVNTDNERRDGHLKGDDFFNAEKFPKMTFVSKSMKPLGGNKYALTGDLTIRDVTKTVTFDVTYGGQIKTKNQQGQESAKAGFKAKATIDRSIFNLKWSRAVEGGGLVVGNEVNITILAELDRS